MLMASRSAVSRSISRAQGRAAGLKGKRPPRLSLRIWSRHSGAASGRPARGFELTSKRVEFAQARQGCEQAVDGGEPRTDGVWRAAFASAWRSVASSCALVRRAYSLAWVSRPLALGLQSGEVGFQFGQGVPSGPCTCRSPRSRRGAGQGVARVRQDRRWPKNSSSPRSPRLARMLSPPCSSVSSSSENMVR